MAITHSKVSLRPDGTDSSLIQPSDWNNTHEVDQLDLPKKEVSEVSLPSVGTVATFCRDVGGRMMLAMMGPSGLDTSLQPLLARNSCSWWCAAGNSTTINATGAATALTLVGTATAATYGLTTTHTKFKRADILVTTAATTAVAGFRYAANMWSRDTGFHMVMRAAPATGQATTATTGRFFMGLSNNTGAPTDVAPSTLTLCVGVGFEGTDTTLFMYTNDGTGTCARTALLNLPRYTADRATMYDLALFAAPGASAIKYRVTDLSTNNYSEGEVSGDIPLLSTLLSPRGYCSVGGTSSVTGISFVSLYLESDF